MINKEEIIERLNLIINMMDKKAKQYESMECKSSAIENCLVSLWLNYYSSEIKTLIQELEKEDKNDFQIASQRGF